MKKRCLAVLCTMFLLAACAPSKNADLLDTLRPLCGKAFAGNVVSTDEADADWRAEQLIMHVADCSETEIRIPLHVGDDRSRTWVISRDAGGRLSLFHQHLHEDGSPDAVTGYGGASRLQGPYAASFPADVATKTLFEANDLTVSKDNVWKLELDPDLTMFSYELTRPQRHFRAEFDLTAPVPTPPPAWGAQ